MFVWGDKVVAFCCHGRGCLQQLLLPYSAAKQQKIRSCPPPSFGGSHLHTSLEQFHVHLITLIFSHVKNNFSHFNDRKQPQNSNKNCTEKTALLSFKISSKLVQFNPNNSQLKINLWKLILHV